MKFSKKIAVTAIALSSAVAVNSVQAASSLSGWFNADDRFEAYLSTDNSVQGTKLYADSDDLNNNWKGFSAFTDGQVALASGQDYFLHIYAKNKDNRAGLIGDLTLSDLSSHYFAGEPTLTEVLTNNLGLWTAGDSGWNNYHAVLEQTGWGSQANVGKRNADKWIWDEDFVGTFPNGNLKGDEAYFSLAIKANSAAAVPEPGVTLLLASGLLAFAGARKKQQKV